MDDTCFSRVVGGLHLRDVDDMPAHARGCDEFAICIVFQLVPAEVRAFICLPLPVLGGRSSAVEHPIEIGGHHLAVMVNCSVRDGPLSPGYTGVGDEDVEAAVELLDNLVDEGFDLV